MEKRGIIDEENTPTEGKCCGRHGCSKQASEKQSADSLEDSLTTRAAQHAENECKNNK